MRVISLIMEKGGVMKTTLATSLAAALSIEGNKTLLIDADPQGHATIAFGWNPNANPDEPPPPNLYDLLVRKTRWNNALRATLPDKLGGSIPLAFLPGNAETLSIPTQISDAALLHKRIQELKDAFDYVVIDTSPSPSLFNASILFATDYAIVPCVPEALPMAGLAATIPHIREFGAAREAYHMPATQILGIVPTMYQSNTIEHQLNLEKMQKDYDNPDGDELQIPVLKPIAKRIVWAEAARRHSIFVEAPYSEAAKEFWTFYEAIMAEVAYVEQ